MIMKKYAEQTAEERAARQAEKAQQLQALIQRLEDGVSAIQSGDQFRAYLRAAARFHRYSANNVLLIMLQRPDATQVAGYTTWQKLKRQVKKGEKGIAILAPAPITITETDDQSGEECERQILRFRLAHVFDVSQTDGDDLPAPVLAEELTSHEGGAVYHILARFAESQDLTVTNVDPFTGGDDTHSSYKGYYHPGMRLIFVKTAAPAQMLKTLIHELGHALDEQLPSAGAEERETVAEATAYMVAAACGIDTGTYSFPYIATWTAQEGGPQTIRRVMERTQRIAGRLIEAIEAHEQEAATLEVAA
jgi:antirestriction protein ArdC